MGSGNISVRPGELVHTVPSVAGAAQPPELFGEAPDSFRGLGLSAALSDHLAASNFNAPTRVQAQAIPAILVRRACAWVQQGRRLGCMQQAGG